MEFVEIGGQLFNLTNRGLLSIEEAGGKEAITKSEAFAETGPEFQTTIDFLEGKRNLYVIDISPVRQPVEETTEEAFEGFLGWSANRVYI